MVPTLYFLALTKLISSSERQPLRWPSEDLGWRKIMIKHITIGVAALAFGVALARDRRRVRHDRHLSFGVGAARAPRGGLRLCCDHWPDRLSDSGVFRLFAGAAIPLGVDGWRWVALIGAGGAIVAWWLRLGLPKSPRWLAQHGRHAEADRVARMIEARIEAETGRPLVPPQTFPHERGSARARAPVGTKDLI